MSRAMKRTAVFILSAFALIFVALSAWVWNLNSRLNERLSKDWFAPPVEFYYGALQIHSGDQIEPTHLKERLLSFDYRERSPLEPLLERDFYEIPLSQCEDEFGEFELERIESCLRLRSAQGELFSVVWSQTHSFLFSGEGLKPVNSIYLEPQLIGKFQGGQPLKSRKVSLSQVPLVCLQAVTAIEDDEFLKHSGVSPSGMARALIRNILAGRFAQGGSTITQQLVKNYFLTHEKTLKRKVTEQILSVLLETKLTKDQILEKYLNVIYMGQEGPYQIIGLGSGAQHYFSKAVSELNLPECALLAALINNPGRYNPFRHPEAAERRRSLVLEKMLKLGWVNENEMSQAQAFPLPAKESQEVEPSAPYFLELAYEELLSLGLPEERGFKVLTTLSPNDQVALEEGVRSQLPVVQKRSGSEQPIEVAAVRVHLPSYHVTSLIGGSHFRTAPYNRALKAQRQIGSIIKPFIYWQAFRTRAPWDKVTDEPFTWEFDGRKWSPRNYERNYAGEITLFEALTRSLNVPAAKLAQEVGIDAIVDTLYAAGFERKVERLPSVALGALEMTPLEVAQVYSTMGNMGSYKKLSSLVLVESSDGEILHVENREPGEERLNPVTTATLVSTMKLTTEIGTARGLKSFVPTGNIAAKTGTTNDLKDAWFVGFTPDHLMIVWVGRDDNGTTKLTGASGALPIWGAIERRAPQGKVSDFNWPKSTKVEAFGGYEFIVGQ